MCTVVNSKMETFAFGSNYASSFEVWGNDNPS